MVSFSDGLVTRETGESERLTYFSLLLAIICLVYIAYGIFN